MTFDTPDGPLLVERLGVDDWEVWRAQPSPPEFVDVGSDRDLSGMLAEALGYNIAHEDFPDWVDELAATVRAKLAPGV